MSLHGQSMIRLNAPMN